MLDTFSRTIARRIGRLTFLLILVTTALPAWAQTPTSPPAPEKNEVNYVEQTSSKGGDQATSQTAAHKSAKISPSGTQDKTTNDKTKKPKRGELIIAPIPISSPAVGSGLVMALGYVFKLYQEDQRSPPSTVGLVGAFTSSGSRAGGIGGRLYFSENKYQTTFVLAKGRVNFDFFGIGRIPGRAHFSAAEVGRNYLLW